MVLNKNRFSFFLRDIKSGLDNWEFGVL